ncbi:MAG: helix-turn-helix transcriptional regulator [Planctomycetes bacterium]|nr:helix-turn-helix transcriptional regulator [Planctomycetota bacterium]
MRVRLTCGSQANTTRLHFASRVPNSSRYSEHVSPHEPRSSCPLAYALDVFGDRWTLLIVRDMLFRGLQRFSEFAASPEGIASNILTDRLKRLEDLGLVARRPDPEDGRRVLYHLTERGLRLGPAMIEILRWGLEMDPDTQLPARFRSMLGGDTTALLAELAKKHRALADGNTPEEADG